MFELYLFGFAPVFIILFIHLTRKVHDIDRSALFGMILASLIPFLREVILILLMCNTSNKQPIFKKYNKE